MALPFTSNDQLLASAARFLIDGGEEMAARVLLSCTLDVDYEDIERDALGKRFHIYSVELTGPRLAIEVLGKDDHDITKQIKSAIYAVLPVQIFEEHPKLPVYVRHFLIGAEKVDIDPDWRNELLEIARGTGVSNQGKAIGAHPERPSRVWSNLRFRSESEVRIAQALDRAGVLFLPNCLGRVSSPQGRKNREADFLVCADGRWGVLEVDGEPFHPPSRTVEDHERDRLFKNHGVRVVEHYDATRCYQEPDNVVEEFLRILKVA